VFITFLAKLILWIMRMLDKKKKPKKPSVPIPLPGPGSGSGGGGTRGKTRTCAGSCNCSNCEEVCPWYLLHRELSGLGRRRRRRTVLPLSTS
jgi:hypothetical protein